MPRSQFASALNSHAGNSMAGFMPAFDKFAVIIEFMIDAYVNVKQSVKQSVKQNTKQASSVNQKVPLQCSPFHGNF